MNAVSLLRTAQVYAALVGIMDLATGLGLLIAPAFTLTQMGAALPSFAAFAFVRFLGVFVACVGLCYLWSSVARQAAAVRTTLILTLFFRAGAGLYTGLAVMTGVFEGAWLTVASTDLTCVVIQSWFLLEGVGRDG